MTALLHDEVRLVEAVHRRHGVWLTPSEARLLCLLRSRPGQWRSTAELFAAVGYGKLPKKPSALIRVHVHFLRRKLGADGRRLESDPSRVRGYRWAKERRIT